MDIARVEAIAKLIEYHYGGSADVRREDFENVAALLALKNELRKTGRELKPAQVLPCPACGLKHLRKARTTRPDGYVKYCKCGFVGYISPTDSKNGGRIVAAWNRAVFDFIDYKYQPPAFKDWYECKPADK